MELNLDSILKRAIEAPRNIPTGELVGMLSLTDPKDEERLFAAAREVREHCGRAAVLPRALIETSNVCAKDCLYCGIRKSREGVRRYRMTVEEVLACCAQARAAGLSAVAFQSGEIESEANTAFFERVLREGCSGLEVTLSLGEQSEEVYRRWKAAGAMRYLLRIETSNRDLYARIHPMDCSFDRRLECIRTLKRLGYVTGTGVMIGLPNQTIEMLAADVEFFGRERVDMVGMGPYIPASGTPLAERGGEMERTSRLHLALRMIAVTRLYLHSVNIVAATALEALAKDGRERALAAGANVVMPEYTPACYRGDYDLYPGKAEASVSLI